MAIPWITRHRKPHGQVRINQGHLLARDIAFYYIETFGVTGSNAGFYDAITGKCTGTVSTVTAAGSTDIVGGGRTSLVGTGNTSSPLTSTAITNPRAVQSTQVSLFVRCKLNVKPSGERAVVAAYGSSSSGRGPLIGFTTSGFAAPGVMSTAGFINATDSTDWTGKWVNIHAQGGGGTGGDCEGYVNGVSIGTNGGGNSSDQAMVGPWLFRDASGYFRSFQGEIALVVGWNRRLTLAEIRAFNADPWQVLLPFFDPGYFSQATGGSPDVTLALSGIAAAASPGSIAKISLFTVPLTGGSATAAAGSVAYSAGSDLTLSLSGSVATAAAGTLGKGSLFAIGLSGAAAIAAAGNIAPARSVGITGSAGAASPGSIVKTDLFTIPLGGNAATASPGNVGATGDKTIVITGTAMTATAGSIAVAGADFWHPVIPGAATWTPQASAPGTWTPQ